MKKYDIVPLNNTIITIKNSVNGEDLKATTALESIPGTKLFVSGNSAGWVSVWNIEEYDVKWTVKDKHTSGVSHLLFLNNDINFLSASDNGEIYKWSVEDSKACKLVKKGSGVPIKGMAYANDGKTIFIAQGKEIILWNIISNSQVSVFEDTEAVSKLIFCKISGLLVWGLESGKVNSCKLSIEDTFETQTINGVKVVEVSNTVITALAFLMFDEKVALAVGANDDVIRIVSLEDNSILKELTPVNGSKTRSIKYLFDKKSFLHLNDSGSMHIVNYVKENTDNFKKKNTQKFLIDQSATTCAIYHGDGRRIVCASESGKIDFWLSSK